MRVLSVLQKIRNISKDLLDRRLGEKTKIITNLDLELVTV